MKSDITAAGINMVNVICRAEMTTGKGIGTGEKCMIQNFGREASSGEPTWLIYTWVSV
jgi:hypothetical protein